MKKEGWGDVRKLKSILQAWLCVGSSCTNRMPELSQSRIPSQSGRGSVAQGKDHELWSQVPLDFIALPPSWVIVDKSISLDFRFYLCKIKTYIFRFVIKLNHKI